MPQIVQMTGPCVLCVWERGAGSGHLFHLLPVIGALRRAGRQIVLCVKDVGLTRRFFRDSCVLVLPLPVRLAPIRSRMARSHPELLSNLGFADAHRLTRGLGVWRRMMRGLQPALVCCDHADMALAAAYSLGIPAVVLGNSFFHPPDVSPMPAYAPALDPGPGVLAQLEQQVLLALNRALGRYRAPPLGRLAALYAYARRLVFSFPELDAYGTRDEIDYLGLFGPVRDAAAPVWRGGGEKAFCYVARGSRPDPELVAQLADAGHSLLLVAPGLSDAAFDGLIRRGVSVTREYVDLARVCAECRLVFCEGNHGTTAKILRSGRVPILVPRQVEQLATAHRLAVQGLGILARGPETGPSYLDAVAELGASPGHVRKVRRFADRYRDRDEADCRRRVEAAMGAILGG